MLQIEQIVRTGTNFDKKQYNKPVVIKWKGVEMVRNHSFLATCREILAWMDEQDLTKIGIIGQSGTGKSTLAEAIAHSIHKFSKTAYTVKIFGKEQLLNFKQTLELLNHEENTQDYILVFDDISFLGADATKRQVEYIKQTETTIRHRPGGRDAKIVLIYNYHYSRGLDKYLRQADFEYYTSVGSQDTENITAKYGTKYIKLIETLKRARISGITNKQWIMRIGDKEQFLYRFRDPFIPCLFWNGQSLRFIVSPKRTFIDPTCATCELAQKYEPVVKCENMAELIKFGESRYGKSNLRSAVRYEAMRNGIIAPSHGVSYGIRYIRDIINEGKASLQDFLAYYKIKPRAIKRRIKPVSG